MTMTTKSETEEAMGKLIEVKRVANAILYKDEAGVRFMKLMNCRASYPFIAEPSSGEDDDGTAQKKYRMTFQLPKATHQEARDLLEQVIRKIAAENKATVQEQYWCLQDGDANDKPEDKGYWLVKTSESRRPVVRDRRADEVTETDKIADLIYGGCWVNGIIRPWFFNGKAKNKPKTYPKRVPSGLQSVQFVRDDTPYGRGRIDDSDAYDSVEEGDGMDEYATADDDEI